jgi:hypothetical protein
MLEKQLPTCSVFENLETLEIGDWCLTDNFNIVLRFMQLSPRLKKLTLVQRQVCCLQNQYLLFFFLGEELLESNVFLFIPYTLFSFPKKQTEQE